MYIPRHITKHIEHALFTLKKTVILYGPRQAGKTTLMQTLLADRSEKCLCVSADEKKYAEVFSSRDARTFESVVAGYDVLFLDEAHRIDDIGLNLKILHDRFPSLRVVATGSSSFELARRTQEPLTGRALTFILLPLGMCELRQLHTAFELTDMVPGLLRYGTYPEVYLLTNNEDKRHCLSSLASSYLFKDVFELSGIQKHKKIVDLVSLLAFQIGAQVSLNELGNSLGMHKDTVAHYLDILEKAFVIFRLSGFSANLRKEVVKMDKYFFYDVGIRNAVIEDFRPLQQRNDIGPLWENFVIAERYKRNLFSRVQPRMYFWRTYGGAELDYVEQYDEALTGFEIKWRAQKVTPPRSWTDTYNAPVHRIGRDNWLSFVADG